MIALPDAYKDLGGFFTELIGVKTLTLQMVHDKLVAEASGQSTPERIKQTIWRLNSYIQTAKQLPDPRQVLNAKVFPVRLPTGTVELCSSPVDFTINDRKHLSDLFSDKARSLDFDVDEVILLEPFLKWTGLDKRYLSSSVKEVTVVHGAADFTLAPPTRSIAQKAHGLLRYEVSPSYDVMNYLS
jgi:hypothetical protein